MKLSFLSIKNFKSIRELSIREIEQAMILVGKNSTGKTVILDAIEAAVGNKPVDPSCFQIPEQNVEIGMVLELDEEDLLYFRKKGLVSQYKRENVWKKDFYSKLPSLQNGKLSFVFVANRNGKIRYEDGVKKNNPYIAKILPKIHFIGDDRKLSALENDIFLSQGQEALRNIRENTCMFDASKKCTNCFKCIGLIEQKSPGELTLFETARLLEYKLFKLNMDEFTTKLDACFSRNSGMNQKISYRIGFDVDDFFRFETFVRNENQKKERNMDEMGAGMRSIYILSLLEAYLMSGQHMNSILMIEDPEMYLHPQIQKEASELLYRLSEKNQVIFSTHSPQMLFNFNKRQLKQVYLDEEYHTAIREKPDLSRVLDDLGSSANDLMNVGFVFIVEGKQDKSRLPLLLHKYYDEIYDEQGNPGRIAIVATNSCTNIRTYANLKYINTAYLKDQFMMIRDSDGKDPEMLKKQLGLYYKDRAMEERGALPRVRDKNILILRYYSFENYFLDPKVMAEIGVIRREEDFYRILYKKYEEYLYRLVSVRHMLEVTGIEIRGPEDIRTHLEEILIYVRGHNLFDIFYGRYKGERENEILTRYIDAAPRETFKDILDSIDRFIYFKNRRNDNKTQ